MVLGVLKTTKPSEVKDSDQQRSYTRVGGQQKCWKRALSIQSQPCEHLVEEGSRQNPLVQRPKAATSMASSGNCRKATVTGVIKGRVDRPDMKWKIQQG